MSICYVKQFCYYTDTIALQMFGGISWIQLESQEYWQDFILIYKVDLLGNTAQKLRMNYEAVKNTQKACTNHVRIKAYSWLFLTIPEIFSLKLGIKAIYPCLGITS